MSDQSSDDLSRQIAAVLQTLTFEQNFVWPVWATAIAANGSMLGLQYRVPGERAHVIAEHVEEPGFVLPVNFVFVSSGDGRAANVTIAGPEGNPEVHCG
jgi:hypothetical protein